MSVATVRAAPIAWGRPFTHPEVVASFFLDDGRDRSKSPLGGGDTFGCDVEAMWFHACRWAQVAEWLLLHPRVVPMDPVGGVLSIDAPPDWTLTSGRPALCGQMDVSVDLPGWNLGDRPSPAPPRGNGPP